MSLQIKNISLYNFRNYQEFYCDNLSNLTIFVGPNAVGKTNIIESIDLLTSISSFKNSKNNELLGPYENFARVQTVLEDEHRSLQFKLHISEGKKKYFYNDKEKPAHKLRGIIPSITFIPDDLLLIKGSNQGRRRALDSLGCQLAVNYPVVKKDYEQILRQKNNLLKNEAPIELLESMNETFITYATQLYCYRVSLFEKLLPYISAYYQDIAHRNEEITAAYIPSWAAEQEDDSHLTYGDTYPDPHDKTQVKELLTKALTENFYKEISAGRALIGPHKDALHFYINKRDATIYGSQGQQRSLVLAWKLAEVRLIEELLGQKPLLLLDDVMSELDEVRRQELTKYVLESTQSFITTTNIDYFTADILSEAHLIELTYQKEN